MERRDRHVASRGGYQAGGNQGISIDRSESAWNKREREGREREREGEIKR